MVCNTGTVNGTYKVFYPYASVFFFLVFCISLVNILLNTFNINSRFGSVIYVTIWGQESEARSRKPEARRRALSTGKVSAEKVGVGRKADLSSRPESPSGGEAERSQITENYEMIYNLLTKI